MSHYRDERREKKLTHVIRHCNVIQWRIQGMGPGSPPAPAPRLPPLFLDHAEARRAEKNSFGDRAAPFLRVWITGAPLNSRSRSGTDFLHVRGLWFCLFYMSLLAPLCPLCLACIWSLLCVSCMRVILTLFVIAHDATVSLRHLVWMRISRRNLVSTNWLQYYLGFATPTGTWSKIAYHEIPLTIMKYPFSSGFYVVSLFCPVPCLSPSDGSTGRGLQTNLTRSGKKAFPLLFHENPASRTFATSIPHTVLFFNNASMSRFWRIPLPNRRTNLYPVKKFWVYSNPTMYFVKIPNPVNTLSDIVSFAAVIRVVRPWHGRSDQIPGGYSTNFYTGRLRPEVQPLTLLYTIFHEKGTPFVYLLLTNGTPFTYLV